MNFCPHTTAFRGPDVCKLLGVSPKKAKFLTDNDLLRTSGCVENFFGGRVDFPNFFDLARVHCYNHLIESGVPISISKIMSDACTDALHDFLEMSEMATPVSAVNGEPICLEELDSYILEELSTFGLARTVDSCEIAEAMILFWVNMYTFTVLPPEGIVA